MVKLILLHKAHSIYEDELDVNSREVVHPERG
jgi:hypothetical protein